MKKSKYTILIPYKHAYIAYNTLWNTSLLIHQNDLTLWGFNNQSNIESLDNRIIQILKKKHVIIDSDIDELEIIKKQLEMTNSTPDTFELTIIPTLACNFSCWYCYENHNTPFKISSNEIENIIKMLCSKVKLDRNIKYLKFQFFGGEPLLCYKNVIVPLIEKYYNNSILSKISLKIGITTNGYLLNSEMIDFLKAHNTTAFQITLDGNRNQHNKVRFSHRRDDSYKVITENIKKCIKNQISVVLRLNISEETNLDVKSLINDFLDVKDFSKYLCFSIHKVWQAKDSIYDTIDNIITEIKTHGFKCASYFTKPSSIWETCYADKENHFVINPEGKIFKCTARNFSDEQIEGYILENGNIKWLPLHYKRKNTSVLKIKECSTCPILPICIGGCSQHLLERKDDTNCPLGMNSSDKIKYAQRVFINKLNIH